MIDFLLRPETESDLTQEQHNFHSQNIDDEPETTLAHTVDEHGTSGDHEQPFLDEWDTPLSDAERQELETCKRIMFSPNSARKGVRQSRRMHWLRLIARDRKPHRPLVAMIQADAGKFFADAHDWRITSGKGMSLLALVPIEKRDRLKAAGYDNASFYKWESHCYVDYFFSIDWTSAEAILFHIPWSVLSGYGQDYFEGIAEALDIDLSIDEVQSWHVGFVTMLWTRKS